MLTQFEKDMIRNLVSTYMEYASLPIQSEKINLWKALNRGDMQRPMVVIDQLPWNELVEDSLVPVITDPYWRNVEIGLRQKIYMWKNFPVDMVLDPFIKIPKVMSLSGYGLTPVIEELGAEDSTAKSKHFKRLLYTIDDVNKIKNNHITCDNNQTMQHEAEAVEYFGDLAPARSYGHMFPLGLWDYLSKLMEVDEAYYEMLDNPDLLHKAMDRLTASTISAIEDANKYEVNNDIANTCHCSYIYTDELLPASGWGKGSTSDNCWAFGLAQLFTSVSPEMFKEFEMPYITRLAEYFGMIYYGCCERLDDRLEHVKKIPNLKKISCSPWSNRENFIQKIGSDLIMSYKPTPASIAVSAFDRDSVYKDIKDTCLSAKKNNVNLEIILKDVSTVNNKPERLIEWADIVMEIVQA